ncbi:TonB-dependent receptor [Aquabacterium sp. OR-4]|uniref:TonB-dependent receptor n=1 Tax=Aquabacterium sp. OR-4 TaxID=2978127 RepID=UPI0021B350F3|nr:TonB-dependent receptor [Aquabacterium sp. OR-4]MDT7834291.1 TonB-dependent receptor [Aquabacterium sp. OR-4]
MSKPTQDAGIRRPASLRTLATPAASPALRSGLALGLSAAMLAPLAATAQTAAATPGAATAKKDETQLPEVKTRAQVIDPNPNAQTGVPYKARTSGDSRHTRPLAETPQTITVITKAAIDESGVSDLRSLLDAQPGITLGTGENGNAFGDRYIIRGQEARSDVFVDGLRDPGMTTRESFALEQIEVSKGPNSSFAGRGTVGGAVNAITKQATLDYDFKRLSASVGSDGALRGTLDLNHIFSDQMALRINALHGQEDVPGRAPSERRRQGLALSGVYEFGKDRQVTLDYYGLRAYDRLDLGSYLVGTVPNRGPANPVPPAYAQEQDFLNSKVDTVTARVKWRLDDNRVITSLTRYGTTDNGYIVTGARSATAYSGTGTTGAYTTASLSTHNAWQEVEYFAHQTNLQWNNQLFGLKNELILGAELSDHKVERGTYAITNSGAFNCRTSGTATANNGYCIYDSTGAVVSGLSNLMGRGYTQNIWASHWQVKTLALSAMDTMDFTDKLSGFAGLRVDRFDFDFTTRNITTLAVVDYRYNDTLFNGHLGLTYKLKPNLIVYGTVSSASDINGGESDVGTNSGYGGLIIDPSNGAINAQPEKSTNLEVGTKWDLMDGKLLASAAVFHTVKRGVMEGSGYASAGTANSGKNRVYGLELSLVGALTDKLSGQLGLTTMKSTVLASATAANVGLPLSNFADHSASAQLKYQANDAIAFGGMVKYESARCAGQPDTAAGYTNGTCGQPVPDYTTLDLFASYRFNRALEARVNVLNVTDKDYYLAAYRSGSFLYKGDARAVRVTVDYKF